MLLLSSPRLNWSLQLRRLSSDLCIGDGCLCLHGRDGGGVIVDLVAHVYGHLL